MRLKKTVWLSLLVLLHVGAGPVSIEKPTKIKQPSPNDISVVQGLVQSAADGLSKLVLHNGVSGKQVELAARPLFFTPQVRWHGEDVVELTLWTSPQKSQTVFYDLIQERKSVPIDNIIAVDGNNMIVANVDGNQLRLVDVFALQQASDYHGENSIALDGNFPRDKSLLDVITRSEFTPQGDFLMRYAVGEKVEMGVRVSAGQIRF